MKRVLRPGGSLVLVDHVASDRAGVRAVQRVLEPLAVRFGADHVLRGPLEHVVNEGFDVEWRQRSKWGIVERVVARKPHPEERTGSMTMARTSADGRHVESDATVRGLAFGKRPCKTFLAVNACKQDHVDPRSRDLGQPRRRIRYASGLRLGGAGPGLLHDALRKL